MRTTHEDKALDGPVRTAASAAADALAGYEPGKACPLCGTLGRHCRPVSDASYFCQQSGLIADQSAFIVPTPDPQAEQVRNDPQRQGAELALVGVGRAFAEADQQWRDACAAAQRARTTARRSEPVFDQDSPTGWRATLEATKLARSVPKLEAAAAEAKRTRDAREIELGIARRDYQRAYDDAARRAGLPVTNDNVAPTDLHSLVGGSW